MTPEKFIETWKDNSLSEKGGAQPHFEDLCRLLSVDPPREYGEYCYEQDLEKMLGGKGFADVWKRGCFAWENKGPRKDLGPALMQLKNYSGALDNPPVLIVCNRERIEIHPCFTGYPSTPRVIQLEDIGNPANMQALRWLFSPTDVYKLRPLKSNAAITADAAAEFAKVAASMRRRGLDNQQVAHFLIQCIFCMYAEDEWLLHRGESDNPKIFAGLLKSAHGNTDRARTRIASLFTAMQKPNGQYGNDDIAWFNGGLFKVIDVPELQPEDLTALLKASEDLDWRAIDPTIFGTLFERGLDPSSRAPLGAHYTDVATIEKLVRPLVTKPLTDEWEAAKVTLAKGKGKGKRSESYKAAVATYQGYLERLRNFRVLDPACGSGNFLYLAMRALKDLEHTAQIDAELMGFGRQIAIEAGPANVLGFEINEYAAELARVTVWIGDIQWCKANGRPIAENPILRSLDGIQHRDALMTSTGQRAEWPEADVILGNPPFLGDRKMIRELGEKYTLALRELYAGDVPGGADLVCYWFYKGREQIETGRAKLAGFVATNSIRGGANRKVVDAIATNLTIFNAWSDEPWVNEGAAVRVSLVVFAKNPPQGGSVLNGEAVSGINSDLTAGGADSETFDLTRVKRLPENQGASFIGTQKNGPFDVAGELAREWMILPNPNGKPNTDVIRPWANGLDITRRPSDTWVIDFDKMSFEDASLYEKPFEYVEEHVKPTRVNLRRDWHRTHWWCHGDPRPAMKRKIAQLSRCILTPRVSKHRVFAWFSSIVLPDSAVVAIARSDDTMFGILHSRFHELWSLRLGTALEDRPRYTPSSTFETFPFPAGLSPSDTEGEDTVEGDLRLPPVSADALPVARTIALAAQRLNSLRENWLNPTDWVVREPEILKGYPERVVAAPNRATELAKRTLTNLYNLNPPWLRSAHEALDKAVASAYGWMDYGPEMNEGEILRRLAGLNASRSKSSGSVSATAATLVENEED
ncbi:class I SAM-dependent DNA methyltransferase [Burkholderia diffusa]|uniref:class I SAM-dependent DNA methyltransferase n=1 Tax=Burkholderia diffusa TaxID=488732 RepID=UPI00084165E8|nr:DNA methyltransferase [Burkholderia diffusa]